MRYTTENQHTIYGLLEVLFHGLQRLFLLWSQFRHTEVILTWGLFFFIRFFLNHSWCFFDQMPETCKRMNIINVALFSFYSPSIIRNLQEANFNKPDWQLMCNQFLMISEQLISALFLQTYLLNAGLEIRHHKIKCYILIYIFADA